MIGNESWQVSMIGLYIKKLLFFIYFLEMADLMKVQGKKIKKVKESSKKVKKVTRWWPEGQDQIKHSIVDPWSKGQDHIRLCQGMSPVPNFQIVSLRGLCTMLYWLIIIYLYTCAYLCFWHALLSWSFLYEKLE